MYALICVCSTLASELIVLTVLSDVVAGTSVTFTAGQTATLNCSTLLDHSVDWTHSETEVSASHTLYTHGVIFNGYRQRFSVDTSLKQQYNLVIQTVRLGDAGYYRCIDNDGLGEAKLFRVSVVEPQVTTSKEITSTEAVVTIAKKTETNDLHLKQDGLGNSLVSYSIVVAIAVIVAIAAGLVFITAILHRRSRAQKSKQAADEIEHLREEKLSVTSSSSRSFNVNECEKPRL